MLYSCWVQDFPPEDVSLGDVKGDSAAGDREEGAWFMREGREPLATSCREEVCWSSEVGQAWPQLKQEVCFAQRIL